MEETKELYDENQVTKEFNRRMSIEDGRYEDVLTVFSGAMTILFFFLTFFVFTDKSYLWCIIPLAFIGATHVIRSCFRIWVRGTAIKKELERENI